MTSTVDQRPQWLRQKEKAVARGVALRDEICIARAEGSLLWDIDGREYIDFASGMGVLNLGHGHPRVQDAMAAQMQKLVHSCFHSAANEPYIALAERLNTLAPIAGPAKSLLLSGGAEANENAIKLARAFTGRPAVLALEGGFHGRTFMALAMTSKRRPHKEGFGDLPGPVYHLSFPDNAQTLASLQAEIERRVPLNDLAAVIVEPVQGEGGIRALSEKTLRVFRALCDRHGIVFIADEIQTGLGRSGDLFAMQASGVCPDLITLGKSLGGGLPLAAVVGRAPVMDCVAEGALGNTFGGNPVACAAALSVLDEMEDRQPWLQARAIGEHCREVLLPWCHSDSAITSVRIRGAMIGLVFESAGHFKSGGELVAALRRRARESGVLTLVAGEHGEVLRLLPALTISEPLLKDGLQRIGDCLQMLLQEESVVCRA
ncbi:MAG: 4-aminobutyrate--2-oxoglutarate transaminase [Spongiibacteraceae bacterium]|nr:4-aminobutyrate--2-oxoglutarate transaminase [Spongiibacteraceae bacterium]